jgi:hypothetical protein
MIVGRLVTENGACLHGLSAFRHLNGFVSPPHPPIKFLQIAMAASLLQNDLLMTLSSINDSHDIWIIHKFLVDKRLSVATVTTPRSAICEGCVDDEKGWLWLGGFQSFGDSGRRFIGDL